VLLLQVDKEIDARGRSIIENILWQENDCFYEIVIVKILVK
jgi:hypothetical protein